MRAGLSPQQIAGILKRSGAFEYCSHEAIYHYIYKERPALIQYLRKKHKKWRKRGMKKARSNVVMQGKTRLSERGAISDEYGHYEVDLVGSFSKATILVVLEKRTRHLCLHKIPNKTAHTLWVCLVIFIPCYT